MKTKLNLKRNPVRVSHKSKAELVRFLTDGKTLTQSGIGGYGSAYTTSGSTENPECVMVYNMQKHKQKFKQISRDGGKTTSIKVSDKSWIAYVYEINVKDLKDQNKMVIQCDKHFIIVSKPS